MSLTRKKVPLLGLAAVALLGPALVAGPARAAGPFQVVMTGLNSPFGLAFGPDGGLYVADAGTGGSGPGFTNGNGEPVTFGDTGDVTRLLNGVQSPVITGLPSVAGAGGVATGLQGLAFDGSGSLFGLFGLGGVESQRNALVAALPAGNNAGDLGQLVRLNTATNTVTPLSDLVPYETANYTTNNPDGTAPEANPFGLAALAGGGFAATDGGGNVALKVAAGGGAPALLTLFPAVANPLFPAKGGPTYQAVPTAITQGPGGSLFVGEFTGFPFIPGAANVFRVDPTTGASSVFASGFTGITGLTFGPGGVLYVLDQTTTSLAGPPSDAQLFRVDPTTGAKTLLGDLAPSFQPSGLVAGPDNALYIATLGGAANRGQVLRFSLAVPEPSPVALLALGLLPLGVLAARKRRKAA